MQRSVPDEIERLAALAELDVLDTPPEREFDALVEAAALVCRVPVSLISLIDADRQWFKANVGLPGIAHTPREQAFCAVTIRYDGILEVPDATLDPRFADNPAVVGEPGVRFYAGAPLCLDGGARVGTLCVVDHVPRTLMPEQRAVLEHLAVAAVKLLEARRNARGLEIGNARFLALGESSPLGVFATDADGACTYVNAQWQAIFGLDERAALGYGWSRTLHPDDRSALFLDWQRAAGSERNLDRNVRLLRDGGGVRHERLLSRPVRTEGGEVSSRVGCVEDVTERVTRELALGRREALLVEANTMADVGGWDLDLVTGTLSWSDHTCRLHGREPGYRPQLEEAIGFYAPEARPVIREAVKRAMAGGLGWDLELPLIRSDRRLSWVRAVGHVELENGEPVRLLGALQDIDRHVRQRQALESAHERMLLATESGRIGIWEWHLGSDALDWTPWMYKLFDVPMGAEPLRLQGWIDRVHPDDRAALERAADETRTGEGDVETELRIVHGDGLTRHVRMATGTVRAENGEALRMLGACWDVTPLRKAHDALIEQRELLRVTLQSIGDAVITTDAAGRVTWLNPVAEQMTGWRVPDAVGRPLAKTFRIVHEGTRRPTIDPATLCLGRGGTEGPADRTVLISRGGEEFGIEESIAPIRRADGEVLGTVLVFHDVTEQRRLSGEMNHRATHDPLTGLVNRAELEARLEQGLARSRRDGSEHALVYIDLDQFKLVNDACGHAVGDLLLQQVAKLMTSVVRSDDTLARIGGDEFAAILHDCPGERAERLASTLCERMDDFRFEHEGRRFRIGASIGLVPINGLWKDGPSIMQAADVSCYAAKEAGRNRVHVWADTDPRLRERERETRWAERLEQAIDEDRFVLYAQRIAAVPTGTGAVRAEVLLRLREGRGARLIQPNAFLPAAERFHLATRIDRWVLRNVIVRLAALPDLSVVDTLSVNVSGQSIGDRAFHQDAIDALTRAGPEVCRRLCLEITETAAVTRMADAVVFVERVRALGAGIALDDFGAGASSFGYLRTLPVDVLKIDGQYISTMIDDALADAAVRCFVDVARLTKVRTVAEYVDRPEVLERVRALGIDYAQGYLLHEPEPIENLLPSFDPAFA